MVPPQGLEAVGKPVSEVGDWRTDISLREGATTVAVWTWSRFQSRLQRMRDIFQESLDRGLEYVQEDMRARPHLDPWLELQEDDYEVLLNCATEKPDTGMEKQPRRPQASPRPQDRQRTATASVFTRIRDEVFKSSDPFAGESSDPIGDASPLPDEDEREGGPRQNPQKDY